MNKTQKERYNKMLLALKIITKGFQTPKQLRISCKADYGLDYIEALEYAYENMRNEAHNACHNVRVIK